MTAEILADTRRLIALRAAIRRAQATADVIAERLRQRREDATRALLAAILNAPDDTARAEAIERARDVLGGAR